MGLAARRALAPPAPEGVDRGRRGASTTRSPRSRPGSTSAISCAALDRRSQADPRHALRPRAEPGRDRGAAGHLADARLEAAPHGARRPRPADGLGGGRPSGPPALPPTQGRSRKRVTTVPRLRRRRNRRGEREERRGRDSNPRWRFTPHTHLAGGRLKPLGHLSGYGIRTARRAEPRSVRYRLMWRRVLVVWSASRLAVLSLGLLLTHAARLAPGARAVADEVLPVDHRMGLGLLPEALPHRLPPGQGRRVLPALPGHDLGDPRGPARSATPSPRVAISNLALLVGLLGMYVLARDRLSEDHARRGVLYLVLSPYAFALAMAYSEGLFLALATWLFVLSDRRRDAAAVPLALAAGLDARHRAGPRRAARAAGLAAPHARVDRRSPITPLVGVRRPRRLARACRRGPARRWCTPSAGGAGIPSIPPVSLADQFLDFATHARRLLPASSG